jgi:hypothetical protein
VGISHHPTAGAETTVAGALGGDQNQRPVRIAMHQARDRGVSVLGERVAHLSLKRHEFSVGGDNLPPDRTLRVFRVHQASQIGCDVGTKVPRGGKTCRLLGSEADHPGEIFDCVKAI